MPGGYLNANRRRIMDAAGFCGLLAGSPIGFWQKVGSFRCTCGNVRRAASLNSVNAAAKWGSSRRPAAANWPRSGRKLSDSSILGSGFLIDGGPNYLPCGWGTSSARGRRPSRRWPGSTRCSGWRKTGLGRLVVVFTLKCVIGLPSRSKSICCLSHSIVQTWTVVQVGRRAVPPASVWSSNSACR